MVILSDIAQLNCQRCKKQFPIFDDKGKFYQGTFCPACKRVFEIRNYKKETKKQYAKRQAN